MNCIFVQKIHIWNTHINDHFSIFKPFLTEARSLGCCTRLPRVCRDRTWVRMFCRNVDTRTVWSWSGFECGLEDLICRQKLWDKGCICRAFHLKKPIILKNKQNTRLKTCLYEFERGLEVTKVVRSFCHKWSIYSFDYEFAYAWHRPALKRRLYRKSRTFWPFCQRASGAFVCAWPDYWMCCRSCRIHHIHKCLSQGIWYQVRRCCFYSSPTKKPPRSWVDCYWYLSWLQFWSPPVWHLLSTKNLLQMYK